MWFKVPINCITHAALWQSLVDEQSDVLRTAGREAEEHIAELKGTLQREVRQENV